MVIMDTLKGTVNTAVDTISTVAQTLVEKNRTNAKLNRLRFIMKNESELMNRAYIALGKQYYENKKGGSSNQTESEEKLFAVIEKSKAKIAKARECYRQIVDSQNDIFYGKVALNEQEKVSSENLVDITVACSNENEYESSPFAAVKDTAEEIKTDVESAAEEVKDAVCEACEKAEQAVEDVAEAVEDIADDSEASSKELF